MEENTIEIIKERLKAIEQEKNITILYACESGSRAWGFPSPDSDYDVRFLYAWPPDRYLSIAEPQDTLNFAISDMLDINGWDIKKILKHFRKSNAVLYEWLDSPIIYRTAPFPGSGKEFREELFTLAKEHFIPGHGLNHYMGLLGKFAALLAKEEEIKLKHLFYILRPLLAACWIIGNQGLPPVEFSRLLAQPVVPEEIREEIGKLLEIKKVSNESFKLKAPPLLIEFIFTLKKQCEEQKYKFQDTPNPVEAFDHFYRKLLKGLTADQGETW